MEEFYSLEWKDGNDPSAGAFAPKDFKGGHELLRDLHGISRLPFDYAFVKLSVGKSGLIERDDVADLREVWLNYEPNNLASPPMSERM